MFQKSVPRVSSMPSCLPLFEKGWQGKPAASTSDLGTFTAGSVSGTMSPLTSNRSTPSGGSAPLSRSGRSQL